MKAGTRALQAGVAIRMVRSGDGEALASLYREAFGGRYPLEDYMDPDRVEGMIAARMLAHHAVAVLEDGRVVGTASRIPESWNGGFEIGRTAVHPDWRRRSIASSLTGYLVETGFEQGLALCHGSCRNDGTVRLSRSDGLTINGFVPGVMQIEKRETFLLGCRLSDRARRERVGASGNPLYDLPAIRRIVRELDLPEREGPYPDATIVGPPSEELQSRLLRIRGTRYSNHAFRIRGLEGLSPIPSQADHLQVDCLIDKVDSIRDLLRFGFQVTGYLPAWYAAGGRRYDCVRLVNCQTRPRFNGEEGEKILKRLIREFGYRVPEPII